MKKIYVYAILSLLAAIILAGCSSDEPESGGTSGECRYVAVNIVQPGNVAGRAEASEGFQYGTDAENKVSTAWFFIFDENGENGSFYPVVVNRNDQGAGHNPEVERIYNAIIVIDGAETKPTGIKKLACVLNPPADDAVLRVKTLAGLQECIGQYGASEAGKFIMSNSVYKNGATTILTADITDGTEGTPGNIHKSASAALANPVDVYVERVVAKVVATSTDAFANKGAKPVIDGVETPLGIKITGVEVANIANSSYLFKNITGVSDTWSSWVWDVNNRRSYWETVPSITSAGGGTAALTFSNKSYNQIVAADAVTDEKKISLTTYVQPNTSDTKTSILVTAKLQKDGADFTDLMFIRGGYTTTAGAENVVLEYMQRNNWLKKTGENTYSNFTKDDITIVNNSNHDGFADFYVEGLEDYEVVYQLKPAITSVYDNTGAEIADGVNTVNTTFRAKSWRARAYTDGMCYYYVEIDHSKVVDAATAPGTYVGVVRNHIYQLNLESIEGVGTPIFNPGDVIIPDRPDNTESYYLAARVNVLAWKLVGQRVQFQGQ